MRPCSCADLQGKWESGRNLIPSLVRTSRATEVTRSSWGLAAYLEWNMCSRRCCCAGRKFCSSCRPTNWVRAAVSVQQVAPRWLAGGSLVPKERSLCQVASRTAPRVRHLVALNTTCMHSVTNIQTILSLSFFPPLSIFLFFLFFYISLQTLETDDLQNVFKGHACSRSVLLSPLLFCFVLFIYFMFYAMWSEAQIAVIFQIHKTQINKLIIKYKDTN